jgi:hypothetical protein
MSEPSIPAPDDQDKPFLFIDPNISRRYRLVVLEDALAPPPVDPGTTSPIEHTLYSVRTFGFTHPSNGRYLMVPKEFQAILVRETKAVATVVWEVMQQTIGWEEAPGKRREWAPLTKRHFVRTGILSRSQAEAGIKRAIEKGYIRRRQIGARRFEYAIRWKGTN